MMDKELIERLKKTAKCVYLATEKSVADDIAEVLNLAVLAIETVEEFHRLATEKAVREALEKAALIADEVNYHIGSKIRALIPEGEKSCSHDWEDAGNQYFDNGDICTKCGATRR